MRRYGGTSTQLTYYIDCHSSSNGIFVLFHAPGEELDKFIKRQGILVLFLLVVVWVFSFSESRRLTLEFYLPGPGIWIRTVQNLPVQVSSDLDIIQRGELPSAPQTASYLPY